MTIINEKLTALFPFVVIDQHGTPLCIVASASICSAQKESDMDDLADVFGVSYAIARPLTFAEIMRRYAKKTIFEHVGEIRRPQRVWDFN